MTNAAPFHRAPDPGVEEASLAEYLRTLWRFRLVLAGTAIAVGLAAFVVSWFRAPTYEATSKLMVSASKIGDATNQTINVGSYQAMVTNQTLVLDTMKELGLTQPPHAVSLAEMMERRLMVDVIRDTNVILLRARLGDPSLAARFANSLARRSVQLSQELSREDTVLARDTIKQQLDETRSRLVEAERRLEDYRKQAQVDALKKDVEALLDQRSNLLPLRVEIEAERARIQKTTQELARQEPVRNARRSVDLASVQPRPEPPERSEPRRRTDAGESDDNTRSGGERSAPSAPTRTVPESPAPRFRDELLDPYVNPVHEILDERLAASRSKLSGLEQQHNEILRATDMNAAGARKLNELYSKQAELDRLQTDAELAKKVYLDVSTRYEQARLQVAGRTPQLQVIDQAVPPEEPVSPRVLRDTALTVGLALVLVSGALLLFSAAGNHVAGRRTT